MNFGVRGLLWDSINAGAPGGRGTRRAYSRHALTGQNLESMAGTGIAMGRVGSERVLEVEMRSHSVSLRSSTSRRLSTWRKPGPGQGRRLDWRRKDV